MLRRLAGATALCLILPSAALADDACVDCHRSETPGAVKQWQQSAHAGQVDCAACHGDDHEAISRGDVRVTAPKCGQCHEDAFTQHSQSKHGLGLHAGWGCTRKLDNRDPGECRFCHVDESAIPISTVQCARFLAQTSEMGELGCNRCHQVELSCASCHTNHLTDLAIVRNPNVCAKCHMGPDHPQWEMWQTSQHGTLYESLGAPYAPSCQTCHQAGGSHDVSVGITVAPSGEASAGEESANQRAQMVRICSDCHASAFVERELTRADAVRTQSMQHVKDAETLIWDLYDQKLLQPMPAQRPQHPLRGHELVTDGGMLYEDFSHIERLFFKMKKYDFAKAWKGAYHQNPAYTHWYGNAELKMSMADIRSEALRLREPAAQPQGKDETDNLEEALRVLEDKVERGALSEEDYLREKKHLLDGAFALPEAAGER